MSFGLNYIVGASYTRGELWAWVGVSQGSASVSVESRGEPWSGQLGVSAHLRLTRFMGGCSPVQRTGCHTAPGDHPRLLVSLLRIPAVCVYASSSPWFTVRPSFSSGPGKAFRVGASHRGLGLRSGSGALSLVSCMYDF